jgi:DNA-binding MarR family transcriptional regulator
MSNEITQERLIAANRLYQQGTDALDQAASELLGVNRTDLRCIDIVLQRGQLSAGELAVAAGLSPGAVTTALDRLERAGYARRVRDPDDRRRVLVQPTEVIAERSHAIWGPLAADGATLVERFSAGDLRAIAEFLEGAAQLQLDRAHQVREQLEREPGV